MLGTLNAVLHAMQRFYTDYQQLNVANLFQFILRCLAQTTCLVNATQI